MTPHLVEFEIFAVISSREFSPSSNKKALQESAFHLRQTRFWLITYLPVVPEPSCAGATLMSLTTAAHLWYYSGWERRGRIMPDNSGTEPEALRDERNAPSESSVFIRLINRYVSVWVWSILFGLTTSLSFTITNVRNIGRFGDLSFAIGALYLLSALFVFPLMVHTVGILAQFLDTDDLLWV
jgi:hypothetical protein